MIGLDTNVLVRYLTQDDHAQAAKANALLATTRGGASCLISSVVLCELVWVFSGAYDLERDTIADTLETILATTQFVIGDKDDVRRALEDYRRGPGDFADYLIGHRNRGAGVESTITFDRKLRKSPLFRVLR